MTRIQSVGSLLVAGGVLAVLTLSVAPAATTKGDAPAARIDSGWQEWFPKQATLEPLELGEGGGEAFQVRGPRAAVLGWVYRTDRMAPLVQGKHGEIGLLVGIGTDGCILGVRVVQQHEDAAYFQRIKASFYASFRGLRPNADVGKPDSVSGATVSSSAIVRDVMQSSQTLLALPAVQAVLKTAAKAPGPSPLPRRPATP